MTYNVFGGTLNPAQPNLTTTPSQPRNPNSTLNAVGLISILNRGQFSSVEGTDPHTAYTAGNSCLL